MKKLLFAIALSLATTANAQFGVGIGVGGTGSSSSSGGVDAATTNQVNAATAANTLDQNHRDNVGNDHHQLSTNADFSVDPNKVTDRATIKAQFDAVSAEQATQDTNIANVAANAASAGAHAGLADAHVTAGDKVRWDKETSSTWNAATSTFTLTHENGAITTFTVDAPTVLDSATPPVYDGVADTVTFTWSDSTTATIDLTDLFDAGAFNQVTQDDDAFTLTFTDLLGNTTVRDFSAWLPVASDGVPIATSDTVGLSGVQSTLSRADHKHPESLVTHTYKTGEVGALNRIRAATVPLGTSALVTGDSQVVDGKPYAVVVKRNPAVDISTAALYASAINNNRIQVLSPTPDALQPTEVAPTFMVGNRWIWNRTDSVPDHLLALNGQAITDADTLYPELWAVRALSKLIASFDDTAKTITLKNYNGQGRFARAGAAAGIEQADATAVNGLRTLRTYVQSDWNGQSNNDFGKGSGSPTGAANNSVGMSSSDSETRPINFSEIFCIIAKPWVVTGDVTINQGGDSSTTTLRGITTVPSAGTISFSPAFKAGTTPVLVGTNVSTGGLVRSLVINTIGNTSANVYSIESDGTTATGVFHWMAIGETP